MLKKMVNGEEVICSPKEEAEIRAEWAKPRPVVKPKPTLQDVINALEAKGILQKGDI